MEDHLNTERGLLAIRLLVEGNSVRTAARITGLHHRTVLQIAVIAGQRCEMLLTSKIRNVPATGRAVRRNLDVCREKARFIDAATKRTSARSVMHGFLLELSAIRS